MTTVLDRIGGPDDLSGLSSDELLQLADDIRDRIVEVMPRNGGHFGSGLGVVELTIALHRVFDFAVDRLTLDVSHQCYPHKMLTGRREDFGRIVFALVDAGMMHKTDEDRIDDFVNVFDFKDAFTTELTIAENG